jgi:predicted nucleic acid-binding protein
VRFWDASALVLLCLEQPLSRRARRLLAEDRTVVAWWGSPIECWSAFARLRREGALGSEQEEAARQMLQTLQDSWVEISPGEEVRRHAGRLLRVHPLRSPDALQLAAALVWAGSPPSGDMVVFDQRLAAAARLEGLTPRL